MQRIKPAYIVIAVVVLVAVGFVVANMVAEQPGERVVDEGTVTETIAVVETNSTAVFEVRLLEGADAEHESEHMFESLAELPGIGEASLDTQSLQFTVAYDDAAIDEDTIRTRLMDAGYLVPTRDDATPTELSTDGTLQTIAIEDNGARFEPYLILASAGVPIEIQFSPGSECRTTVKFPQVGVVQDISQGGTVALPALEPGQYQITCSGDAHEGAILVE
jgi:hypothetical protein